jgi:hypothetical protein
LCSRGFFCIDNFMTDAVVCHAQHTNTQNKMNKNAYEIRLEVLQLAHGDIMTEYHEALNCQKETIYQNGQESSDLSGVDVSLPDASKVLARAEELYKFVEKS